MSAIGSIFAAIVRIPLKAIQSISKLRPSANAVMKVKMKTAPLLSQKSLVFSIIGIFTSALWFIVWMGITAILWVFIPVVIGFLLAAFSGVNKCLGRYTGSIQNSTYSNRIWRTFLFVTNFVAVVLQAFVSHVVLFILAHFAQIIITLVVAWLFIYLVERHLNWVVEIASIISDCVVAAYNTAGGFLEVQTQIMSFFNPLINSSIRGSITLSIHIYDALVYTQEHFGVRRVLANDALIYADAFFELVEPFMKIILMATEWILQIQTMIIDLMAQVGFFYIMPYIMDILNIVITKGLCFVAGGWCSLAVVGEFLLVEVLLVPVNALLGLFGAKIDLGPIGCTVAELESRGVGSECAGTLISIDPAGIFSALLNSRRRLRVTCSELDGMYSEHVDDMILHRTANASDACPYSRSSFHPYGHSLNMMALDTHGCYEICARGVLFEACESGRVYRGSCDMSRTNFTIRDARRRLDNFFETRSFLSAKSKTTALYEAIGSPTSRIDVVNQLRQLTGTRFTLGNFQCDLTQPSTNAFETLFDIGCIIGKVYQSMPKKSGRRLSVNSGPSKSLMMIPGLGKFRHHLRLLQHHTPSYIHPKHDEVSIHPFIQIRQTFIEEVTFRAPIDTIFKKIKVYPIPESSMFKHNYTRIPQKSTHGRSLETIIECPPGERLCANMNQCVTDYKLCDDAPSYGVITWAVFYIEKGVVFLENFDPATVMSDIITCWRSYGIGLHVVKHPEKDPLSLTSLRKTEAQRKAECYWCFPMFPPWTYTHDPWVFSLRESFAESCVSVAETFRACQCVMFYDLPSTTLPLTSFFSADLGYIVANGLIYFKNAWIMLVGNFVGNGVALVFPNSRIFSLYSDSIEVQVYLLCQFIHTGSALVTIVIIIVIFQLFRASFAVLLFVLSYGQTYGDRIREWNVKWMNYHRVWNEMFDPSGAVSSIQRRLDILETKANPNFNKRDD